MSYCGSCGEQLGSSGRFCGHCGSPIPYKSSVTPGTGNSLDTLAGSNPDGLRPTVGSRPLAAGDLQPSGRWKPLYWVIAVIVFGSAALAMVSMAATSRLATGAASQDTGLDPPASQPVEEDDQSGGQATPTATDAEPATRTLTLSFTAAKEQDGYKYSCDLNPPQAVDIYGDAPEYALGRAQFGQGEDQGHGTCVYWAEVPDVPTDQHVYTAEVSYHEDECGNLCVKRYAWGHQEVEQYDWFVGVTVEGYDMEYYKFD